MTFFSFGSDDDYHFWSEDDLDFKWMAKKGYVDLNDKKNSQNIKKSSTQAETSMFCKTCTRLKTFLESRSFSTSVLMGTALPVLLISVLTVWSYSSCFSRGDCNWPDKAMEIFALASYKPVTTLLVLLVTGAFFYGWMRLRLLPLLLFELIGSLYFWSPVSIAISLLYGDFCLPGGCGFDE